MKTAYMQNKQITQFDHFVKTKLDEVETDAFMAQKGFEQYLAKHNKPSRNKRFLWLLLLLLVPASFIFFFTNNGKKEDRAATPASTGNMPVAVQPAPANVSAGSQPGPGNNMVTQEGTISPGVHEQNVDLSVTRLKNTIPAGNKKTTPDTGTAITGIPGDARSKKNDKTALFKDDSIRVKTITPQKEDTLYIVW